MREESLGWSRKTEISWLRKIGTKRGIRRSAGFESQRRFATAESKLNATSREPQQSKPEEISRYKVIVHTKRHVLMCR